MATNRQAWIKNIFGAPGPMIFLGKFELGSTQEIKRGEILELTADTNSSWTPMDSDFAMAANVSVAKEEIKNGDRMGFYEIVVPRPGDVFEFALATASAIAVGTALYWSTSQVLTTSAGSYIVGDAVGQEHYPQKQGHLADDASGDAGETIRSTSYVRMMFRAAVSYYAALQT